MSKVSRKRQTRWAAPEQVLRVTREDIDAGVPGSTKLCAVAQTLKRMFRHVTYLVVSINEIAFSLPELGVRRRYFPTAKGAKYIFDFDAGKPIKPFTLHLSDGMEMPIGWQIKHPNSSRKGKKYRKTGKRSQIRYTKERVFGACVLQECRS